MWKIAVLRCWKRMARWGFGVLFRIVMVTLRMTIHWNVVVDDLWKLWSLWSDYLVEILRCGDIGTTLWTRNQAGTTVTSIMLTYTMSSSCLWGTLAFNGVNTHNIIMIWISTWGITHHYGDNKNQRDGLFNHQPQDHLLNHLFKRRLKNTSRTKGQ